MIAARSANENLTPLDVMLAVMRDPQVSLADRVKMALKALPRLHRKPKAGQSGNATTGSRAATVQSFGRPKDAAGGGTGKDAGEEGDKCPGLMPLDFLLSVIRHPKTPAALQVKVSLATLPYIHPKQSSRPPKPAVVADRYGFEVDPALAKKLRNKIARLAQLKRRRSPHPGDQKTIQRLHQEANLMIAALQCPCPSRYNDRAPANDRQRLERLWRKRRSRAKLTPAEDGELAHLNARYMACGRSARTPLIFSR